MDWSKTKSILIIVLLILNLTLVYSFFREQQRFEDEKKNNIADVIKLYKNREIVIETKKFDFSKSIKSVNIDFETFGMENVKTLLGSETIFDGEKYISNNDCVFFDETQLIFSKKEHYDSVKQDEFQYLSKFRVVVDEDNNRVVKDKMDAYLTSSGVDIVYDDFEVLQSGFYTLVKLYQKYEMLTFEESKTSIWFFEGSVVGFNKENVVNISESTGSKYDIISIDRILYGLLPKLKSGDVIESISIIYKLNDESLLVSNLVLGEALPYYQIILKSGEAYHIRAIVNL